MPTNPATPKRCGRPCASRSPRCSPSWLGVTRYALADAVEWIRSRAQLAAEAREYAFAIVYDEGRFLGGRGLNQINHLHQLGNVGYWLRTSATGRGVATEAVRQLAEFAFRNTTLVRLEIVCARGHERSQRVAERAGALREALLRQRLLLHGWGAWMR